MSDLVPYAPPAQASHQWVELMAPAADLARQIASTDFVPAAFKGKPAAVAAAILYGAEIGLGPMQSLAKVDIVEGRPAPRAELARALVLSAGHEMWIEEASNTRVTVCGRRRGSDVIQRVSWSMDDAKRAGLDGRQNYRKYPRQMLTARASAELARLIAPDALGGISYFAEELDGERAEEPAVTVPEPPKGKRRKLTEPAAAVPPEPAPEPTVEDDDITDAEVVTAETDDPMTDRQKKMMLALFGSLAITDRADRLQLTSTLIGRQVSSASELTKDEASKVIDQLDMAQDGRAGLVYNDDGTIGIEVQQELPT